VTDTQIGSSLKTVDDAAIAGDRSYNESVASTQTESGADPTMTLAASEAEPTPTVTKEELVAHVAARLRSWRIRRGLSQSAVAMGTGLDQSSVSNYESGKRDIPVPAIVRLIATLNVSLGDLVDPSLLPGGDDEVIVARHSLLGEAVSRLIVGRADVARARRALELTWDASRLARAMIASAAEQGADLVVAAVQAVDRALAIADERHLDRTDLLLAVTQSAVVEASLVSQAAAQRVQQALEARRLEQLPD